jgi:cob(I)alamin adenosyltransferase
MNTIYTKKGDAGETGLYNGKRVPKNHVRMEACGTIDEANALIGLALMSIQNEAITKQLKQIQHLLFYIGAIVGNPETQSERPNDNDVTVLEQAIDTMTTELPALTHFILPGGTILAARIHVARTAIRQAERRVVTVSQHQDIPPIVIQYLNRLSDYLFVLARYANHKGGVADQPWIANE